MIETNKNIVDSKFQKKILGYLDGSLSSEDKSEFEAYVRTHPEFETQIQLVNQLRAQYCVKKMLEPRGKLDLAEPVKLNQGEQRKAQINRHRQASADNR